MKQIPGQMSLFDILGPENDKDPQKVTENCENLPLFDPYDYLTWCDWCAYQDETKCCTYDEPLGRFCSCGAAFKPKRKLPATDRKTCRTCSHFGWVWNPDGEPYRRACFGFGISKSDNPNKPACETYEEREEGK